MKFSVVMDPYPPMALFAREGGSALRLILIPAAAPTSCAPPPLDRLGDSALARSVAAVGRLPIIPQPPFLDLGGSHDNSPQLVQHYQV